MVNKKSWEETQQLVFNSIKLIYEEELNDYFFSTVANIVSAVIQIAARQIKSTAWETLSVYQDRKVREHTALEGCKNPTLEALKNRADTHLLIYVWLTQPLGWRMPCMTSSDPF